MDYDKAKKKLQAFKPQLLSRMEETARQAKVVPTGATIPYSDLTRDSGVEVHHFESGQVRQALSEILGEIGEELHGKDLPMLTAVVVHKGGDLRPGAGFYELAESLEKLPMNSSAEKKEEFWWGELKKVYNHYKKN